MNAPNLASMLAAGSADEFADLEADGNEILLKRPNHLLISPQVFVLAEGARTASSKELAFGLTSLLAFAEDDDSEEVGEKEAEREWVEELLLASLWASEKGLLTPIALADVPETALMNHLIRSVKDKLGGGKQPPAVISPTGGVGGNSISLELMAASTQNLVSILNRIQDGTEDDKFKREAEKSIMKAMGPTQ